MNGKVGQPDGAGSDEGDVVCVGGHGKGREGRVRRGEAGQEEGKSHDHVSHAGGVGGRIPSWANDVKTGQL